MLVLRGSLDRESLQLGVVRLKTADQRLGWLADHLGELHGSGIIYCLTVAPTQEIADFLRARGHNVAAYSGQTETTEREALEHDLAGGRVKALVATSALGMGFDATLGFVINVGAPSSPVAYYQQVGRAGRGTDKAQVVLLPALEDRDIWKYFASLAFPPEGQVRQMLSVLDDAERPLGTASLETYVDLSRTRLETMLKVLDVDGAVRRVQGGWESHRPGRGTTTRTRYDRVARRASASSRRCSTTSPPTAAGCSSSATSSTTPMPRSAAAATTAAGSPSAATVSEQAHGRGPRAAEPARRRDRAPQDVADRAGQPRHRPQGQDRRPADGRAGRSPG